MTYSLSLLIAVSVALIALCSVAVLIGLAVLAQELRRMLTSLERLASRIETKLDPLERGINETMHETRQTLIEVRTQAREIGESGRVLRQRCEEIGAIAKFVVDKVESPLVRTVGAAAGMKAGLGALLRGLRGRKEGARHGSGTGGTRR